MYWITRYGEPPRGLKGLDATVDSVSIDFRFENNTGNWIAIRSWTKDSRVFFELWGKDPGWKVEVDGPKIDKIVPADREIVYRDEPTMAEGQELAVEGAMDGFESIIHRKVTKEEKVISELTLRSNYVPARNVILVHPRTPTPTATATPQQTATPRPGLPTPALTPVPTTTPRPNATPGPR